MTTQSGPIVFYDIEMKPPTEKTCCSPNPWKTRHALNFKNLSYKTIWVSLPDVTKTRKSLGIPACRKFADGSDYYTLPVLIDPTTDSKLGDSYDIAIYLNKTYPDSGAGDLFPDITLDYSYKNDLILIPLSDVSGSAYPEYAKFNMNVDLVFSMHAQLACKCFPFDPKVAPQCQLEFAKRAGLKSWDDFAMTEEAREKTKESLRSALGELGKLFLKDTSGPFVRGEKACYADIIVGSWLKYFRATLPESEWEELRSWHDGLYAKLHDALEVYAEVK